jgi:hypothetical protein
MMVAIAASADKLGIFDIVYPHDYADELRARLRMKQARTAEARAGYTEMEAAAVFLYGMCQMYGRGWCFNKREPGALRCSDCAGKSKGQLRQWPRPPCDSEFSVQVKLSKSGWRSRRLSG